MEKFTITLLIVSSQLDESCYCNFPIRLSCSLKHLSWDTLATRIDVVLKIVYAGLFGFRLVIKGDLSSWMALKAHSPGATAISTAIFMSNRSHYGDVHSFVVVIPCEWHLIVHHLLVLVSLFQKIDWK